MPVYKLASPVVVSRHDVAIYGRIVRFQGGEVEVMTPGGSKLTCGMLWMHSVRPEEQRELRRLERYTLHEGRALYRATFSLEQQAQWGLD